MQNEQPLISLIIPVYNVAMYLEKCIESAMNQSYSKIEILIIDDGSTDSSSKICDNYASKDDRILVIHQKNGGRSVARNRGIDESRGEYLLFLDGDDWLDSCCVEKLYEAIKENSATLAVGRYRAIYKNFICDDSTNEYLILEGSKALEFYIRGYKTYQNANSVCVKLYSKELLKDIRFEEGRYYEDIMFVTKIYHLCKRCVYLDQAFYNYNIGTETSITYAGVNELTFRDEIPILEEKENFLVNIGRTDLAETFAWFKYQKLLTYYRQCHNSIYKRRIKDMVFKDKNKILILLEKEQVSKREGIGVKLFLYLPSAYILYYELLKLYGKRFLKRKRK